MPVVIALLNSYSGLAAAAAGFVLDNPILIVSGSLVGASGLILTTIMCNAMNRSIWNVIFGAFGAEVAAVGGEAADGRQAQSTSAEDAAIILAYAKSVIFVPGYGLAAAQAQHHVRELADLLQSRGVETKHAIHPVAGRMPGHMNVLLAEADVPYDQLYAMEDINDEFERTDVAVVIGANDVTNPVARGRSRQPHIRYAHTERGQGQEHHLHQAKPQPRIRWYRQSRCSTTPRPGCSSTTPGGPS